MGVAFFGARDGTRTHTAVATRTSNVIVYHSNTLAYPSIIAAIIQFVNNFSIFDFFFFPNSHLHYLPKNLMIFHTITLGR